MSYFLWKETTQKSFGKKLKQVLCTYQGHGEILQVGISLVSFFLYQWKHSIQQYTNKVKDIYFLTTFVSISYKMIIFKSLMTFAIIMLVAATFIQAYPKVQNTVELKTGNLFIFGITASL